MFYLFVLLLGVLAICAYLFVIFREVPGAVDERLGKLEALPPDLGIWRVDSESDAGQRATAEGLIREVRLWHEPSTGLFRPDKLVEQVRYRSITTSAIERVEPDRPLKRRRIRPP